MEYNILYNSPDVANCIKTCAKQKNISLKQILQDCSLGANTFSHMLHGRALAFDSLAKIADYLGCSVDYLLGRTETSAQLPENEAVVYFEIIGSVSAGYNGMAVNSTREKPRRFPPPF